MTASVELTFDLTEDHLSVRDAATECHVSEATIRQWKRRGHLKPSGLDEFGRPMYRAIDVLRAQAKAEQNASRTRARSVSGV